MKKIVIIPEFANSHILAQWIDNMVKSIQPTHIIINSGLFPHGPENKGHVDNKAFLDKYTFRGQGVVSFDLVETDDILTEKSKFYSNVEFHFHETVHLNVDANKCFLHAISHGLDNINVERGDIIFPLEPDAFLLESDFDVIQQEIEQLRTGQGLKCLWRDFVGSQYYCENVNEVASPKIRRFCYCFDNMENYLRAMDGFMSQDYPLLTKTDAFWIRHYPWFVYDKWKELRFDLIYRSSPEYWKDFDRGLTEIKQSSQIYLKYGHATELITVRPSRQHHDPVRYVKFIDCQHPEAIKTHPCYLKN
jgi:hypothetical protein